jgi:hypothetical protein
LIDTTYCPKAASGYLNIYILLVCKINRNFQLDGCKLITELYMFRNLFNCAINVELVSKR